MIKNLLDADENPPEGTKVIIEETIVEPSVITSVETNSVAQTSETENFLEIPPTIDNAQKDVDVFAPTVETANFQTIVETQKPENTEPALFQANYAPESTAETMRKSGLAYAAAITLFAAVVFMMIIGWGADLLLGSSPWGIVGGIVLGAIIGFVQFFRLTSQILKNKE